MAHLQRESSGSGVARYSTVRLIARELAGRLEKRSPRVLATDDDVEVTSARLHQAVARSGAERNARRYGVGIRSATRDRRPLVVPPCAICAGRNVGYLADRRRGPVHADS